MNPAVYDEVKVTPLSTDAEIAPAGSADLVLTFRNVHNWMAGGVADRVFAAFFAAPKPGGVLGVEEHRASTAQPQDPKAANGYVREDYTIQLAEKAGFSHVGKSEILANPKDTKDWPKGVWTLPPTLALRAGSREVSRYRRSRQFRLEVREAEEVTIKSGQCIELFLRGLRVKLFAFRRVLTSTPTLGSLPHRVLAVKLTVTLSFLAQRVRSAEEDMQTTRVGDFEVLCVTEFEGPFIAPEVFFSRFRPGGGAGEPRYDGTTAD